jgi:methionyl-tRNA formyltransferase
MTLRLAFMGTPDFAVPSLAALIAAGHDIVAVYTQPARPKGRGHKPQPSPVAELAARHSIDVRTPERLGPDDVAAFAVLNLDMAVVVAYGLILPKAILDTPRLGCVNVHASLLPRWRGAAPIERAILAGDAETGITIMKMAEGLDTGPILLAQSVPIGSATTASELHETLAELGAALLVKALDDFATGEIVPRPQAEIGATYAKKLRREEGALDWRKPAHELGRLVRALNPRIATGFMHEGERIRVLAAAPIEGKGAPGQVLDAAPTIACGEGALRLLKLQREGRTALSADEFLRGHPIPSGTVLPCPATS